MLNYAKDIIDIDIPALVTRIRELEAELQVRDDMGDEVLRILREATGRRDFHSEMEAAQWAARMILDLQTQLFLSQQSSKEAMDREAAAVSREIGVRTQLAEARANLAKADDDLNSAAYDLERQGRELAEARQGGGTVKRVNERRWALVGKMDGEVKAVGPRSYVEYLIKTHGDWCRLARVQITEIKEESGDKR